MIRAERHVHMSTEDMAYYGVKDGDYMKLKIEAPAASPSTALRVRYHPKVVLEVHIDTDEGNACDLESATNIELLNNVVVSGHCQLQNLFNRGQRTTGY